MGFIISDTHESHVSWGIWEVKETAEEMLDGLILSDFDKNEFENISHPSRILEWVAARKAMQELGLNFGINYKGIIKESNGKSYLKDNPTNISISHTKNYAAVILNSQKPVGIDIELMKDKIELIAHKFISNDEFGFIATNMQKLTIAWCVKEAVYKCLGLEGLAFKDHIRLSDFHVKHEGDLESQVQFQDLSMEIPLKYILKNNFCVAFTL